MNGRRLFLSCLLCLLANCGPSPSKPDVDPPSPTASDRFSAGTARLLSLSELGQVVSRNAAGGVERVGEALLWTWTAIGTLRCDDATDMTGFALGRIEAAGGNATRFEPLPAEYQGNEISLDGEVGIWLGMAARARRCPADRPALARVWQLRQAAITAAHGRLHPNVHIGLPPGWGAARDQVGAALGLGAAPAPAAVELLGGELAAWALIVTRARAECFRLNVAWTVIRAFEEAGGAFPARWRTGFCSATQTAQIPTIDQWCGREGLQQYLDGFKANEWEYRHQRCGGWETPDGAGFTTPGLDELVALRQQYGETL